ncbi:MAG: LLM class F420-dependent oxidoreductase [Actinomycetota bacterium]|nr:LLM class F420-dependent oxidoreductase [Actinomycetota bacterium]
MRLSYTLSYTQDVVALTPVIQDLESAGLDLLWLQEAYSFDAVSALGYLAGKTSTIGLGSAILNAYSRTPAVLGMTAAGLDHLSGGRFHLGLGASGPQVVEGFHGMPYSKPLTRTKEVVEIVRKVVAREVVEYTGETVSVPLTKEAGGTGLGKPLKLINKPDRPVVPIYLAALGDKSVETTAEIAEGWLPFFWVPENAQRVFGASLTPGLAKRSAELPALDIVANTTVAIGENLDREALLAGMRNHIALYVGGMGARNANFYNDLAQRMGWVDEALAIQEFFLTGKREEAAAAVPQAWLDQATLVGSASFVAERLAAYRESGVTSLDITIPAGIDPLSTVEQLRAMM